MCGLDHGAGSAPAFEISGAYFSIIFASRTSKLMLLWSGISFFAALNRFLIWPRVRPGTSPSHATLCSSSASDLRMPSSMVLSSPFAHCPVSSGLGAMRYHFCMHMFSLRVPILLDMAFQLMLSRSGRCSLPSPAPRPGAALFWAKYSLTSSLRCATSAGDQSPLFGLFLIILHLSLHACPGRPRFLPTSFHFSPYSATRSVSFFFSSSLHFPL
mmetsp:Transcript_14381/g.56763  ORF Transcript_14381/g.56763 Transcript_14381/m.56763 type:complete len:214 (-) Transcript_14381:364-1005(-)